MKTKNSKLLFVMAIVVATFAINNIKAQIANSGKNNENIQQASENHCYPEPPFADKNWNACDCPCHKHYGFKYASSCPPYPCYKGNCHCNCHKIDYFDYDSR